MLLIVDKLGSNSGCSGTIWEIVIVSEIKCSPFGISDGY